MCCAVFALALPAQTPAPQAPWLAEIQQIQQEMHRAPLGSLDARLERAWKAALAAPRHPQFRTAAQMAWHFYQFQGYELKAEQLLRDAIAATAKGDLQPHRGLLASLAAHFESAQQPVKAVPMREKLAAERAPGAASSLAHLYERIGETGKAEAAWKQVMEQREEQPAVNRPGGGRSASRLMGAFFSPGGASNELASFYARHGRQAEAEQIYEKALEDAARSGSAREWTNAAEGYIGLLAQQRRFDEAIGLARRSLAAVEAAPEPEPNLRVFRMHRLAGLLMQAGRPAEAVAVQNRMVEAAPAGSPEALQALSSLAEMLMQQKRLEEAEKTVARMREAGGTQMGDYTLARIREMQNKPEEARRLRESAAPPVPGPAIPERTVYEAIGPAQQALMRGDTGAALAAADEVLALAAARSAANPQEIAPLMGLAGSLMAVRKEAEARRILAEAFRILDGAPDHPRVADALASGVSTMVLLGMTAEAERAIARQEKILIAAKGSDTPALRPASYARSELMTRAGNPAGVVEERRRMLAITEKSSGPKSRDSLYALREVAWAYPPLQNWGEEEAVLAALLESTVAVAGASSLDHAHILVHMANRASENREFDKALAWIDRAIEAARTLPDAAVHLPPIVQNREQIVRTRSAPAGSRWFDTDGFSRTDGTRLGTGPRP